MRRTYVKSVGPPNAKLAICGEQPGKQEIFKGQPFVGPAGQELWKILYPIGIARQEVYVTNVIKDLDAHLKTYIDLSPRSGPVVSDLGWEYISELRTELENLRPNVVLALGNIALFALTSRTGITKWAGSVIESTLVPGLKVVPTFHPATVIAPKFQYLNRHLIRFDARRALEESITPAFLSKPRKVIINPTFEQSMSYLKRCYEEGLKGRIIEWDIEVVNEELNCFSVAYRSDEAMSIPFIKDGDYFTISQEYEILMALARILEDPRIPYGGANNIFDCQFMLHKYGIRARGEHHCTQIAQKITWPDYNAGLDFVTRMHTDIPYYKADGKKWMKVGGSWSEWWSYNAMDSIATASARGPQIEELQLQHNLETYNRQRALVSPLLYMMERGIRVDVEGMKREQEKEQHELEQLQEKLNELAGYELNSNSPKQLIDYFYDKKGIKPYKKRSTTGAFVPTTDVDALKRLAKPTSTRKGYEEAQIILKMRGLRKRISTYLNIGKVDLDGRYRSQYKPAGTDTGRLASGETIFGTGCMPPDAECLTKNGWVNMLSLSDNPVEIMQWDTNNNLSWCLPKINIFAYQGDMIQADSSTHKALYTPNHKIPYYSKRMNFRPISALEASNKNNWRLPLSGIYSEGKFSVQGIEILAMIQADGSIEGNGVRFTFVKQRKIDRFKYLMNKYGLEYSEQSAKPGERRFYIHTDSALPYITIFKSLGKMFGSWVLLLDQKTMSVLLEEIKYWDSYIRGNSFIYYSSIKQNAEWVATMAHLCNKSATITTVRNNRHKDSYGSKDTILYQVNIKPRNNTYQESNMYSKRYYNWNVYCPTVKTGYFLCRYKGTIFVTGNSNQQNWPHDLLQFFLADDGYLLVSIDLSQIENRIVAYVGNVVPMIKAFETGIDVHSLTAAMIFNKPIDQISDEDGSCSLGDGRQSERYWGKKCVLETAQVLTPHGWLPINIAKHYNLPIAQWNKNKTISFTVPIEWYESTYTGDIITIKNHRIFQEATPDHKMPLHYNGSIITKPISKYPKSGKYKAPLSGIYSGDISIPDPLIRLLVAFQADGSWNYNGISFKLHKPRKIKRIKAILEIANIDYHDNPSQISISAKHDICKFIQLVLGREKLFGDWLLSLNQQSLLVFLDELPYWDGHIDYKTENYRREYFTTIKQNAEWVQTIAHLCNKASNIYEQDNSKTSAFGNKILYRVNIRDSIYPATSAIERSVRKVVNQKIFCPTVPSGFFLVKENNKISVTGNSNHGLNYDLGYKNFALRYEITEKEANWIVEKYHQSYPGVRQNYHAMIQSQLKEDRTITNLFGRRRIFMGPIVPDYPNVSKGHCHNTFKEAYAHLPQSTTADKINEHGVNYIYYNQQWFAPVELLTQIHDSVVFQIPLSLGWIRMAEIIRRVKDSLEQPLKWHDREFKVPADTSIGLNMFKKHMKEIKSRNFPYSLADLAKLLEETYDSLIARN